MRIGQRGTLTRMWARKGTRPRIVRQRQSESAYIFGTNCAQQDAPVCLCYRARMAGALRLLDVFHEL
jgi:hypothetical protein